MISRKEELLAYLRQQGFQPKEEDFGIFFRYQMLNFLIFTDDEDPLYIRLVLPGIMDVDQNNREDVLEACNRVTCDVKVAKCFISDNKDVWIACEQLLDQDPKYDDILPRSLHILMVSQQAFFDAINA